MKKLRRLLFFLIIYIVIFCISYFFYKVNGDEFWSYGYAYNISRGLVPYRDFNIIVTPLYSFILSFFIFIFGHHLFIMYILNTFLLTFMCYFMYKKIKYNVLLLVPLLCLINFNGYNLLVLFITFFVVYLEDIKFKNKDFIIGFIVGLLILTKHTVGFSVFIPCFFMSKNKIKFIIGSFIPVIIFVIYLIVNSALYSFINYSFLGLFDFASGNGNSGFLFFTVILIISLLIIYKYNKSNIIFIIIMYQIMAAPLFDLYHFWLGFILFFYYFLYLNYTEKKSLLKIIGVIFKYSMCGLFIINNLIIINYNNDRVVDKKSFLYGRNFSKYNTIHKLGNYYKNNIKNYDNIFIFSSAAYCIKMNINANLNKYDINLKGNNGYKGDVKFVNDIKNICSDSKCLFIINNSSVYLSLNRKKISNYDQINYDSISYVVNNYDLKDNIDNYNIYYND